MLLHQSTSQLSQSTRSASTKKKKKKKYLERNQQSTLQIDPPSHNPLPPDRRGIQEESQSGHDSLSPSCPTNDRPRYPETLNVELAARKAGLRHCCRRGSGDRASGERRSGELESAEALAGRRIGEQSSQGLPWPIAGGEQAGEAADTRLIVQGQCQGRGRVPGFGLAEQGEHARKCREQRRGNDEHRGAAAAREHGLEFEPSQRQGTDGAEDPVLRQFVRPEGKVEQYGQDIGPVFQRAEREVSLLLFFDSFSLLFSSGGGLTYRHFMYVKFLP